MNQINTLYYTSGTTGEPKAAALTVKGLSALLTRQIYETDMLIQYLKE